MTFAAYMRRCATEYLSQLMERHRGCVRAAAIEAGCNSTGFYRLLQRCGIEPPRTGRGSRGNTTWQALQ